MTAKHLSDLPSKIEGIMGKHEKLILYLHQLINHKIAYDEVFLSFSNAFAPNANNTHQNVATARGKLNQLNIKVLDEVRHFKPATFIHEVNSLVKNLTSIKAVERSRYRFDHLAEELIDLHTDAYSERGTEQLLEFVKYCQLFISQIKQFDFISELLLENYQDLHQVPGKDEGFLDIEIFNEKNELKNFSSFLLTLDELYRGICRVYNIHYEDYPLKIVKVESGSIWVKLLGNISVVKLIRDVIFGISHYLRDLQTGQINLEKFENEAKQSAIILNLISQAKENGVEEQNIILLNKTLNKSIQKLGSTIPIDTVEIKLNEERVFSLTDNDKKQLNGNEIKYIEGKEKKD